eukprot:CAMPEP_0204199168 /NCGR_PEP_ID=MMETSP0361-20130328/65819_1 /ASSEMBLY_ACC=CAM_ASM_000343 /TAXON_ID=268821 /ORGANISM="Scrippsiella Hangoei, Strain SHTV-5" /LENGTH=94 /DNA_ID=CAMNT_0051161413 /DNA_START=117 /DNA_END=398 /DNA_ORIENTATION=+
MRDQGIAKSMLRIRRLDPGPHVRARVSTVARDGLQDCFLLIHRELSEFGAAAVVELHASRLRHIGGIVHVVQLLDDEFLRLLARAATAAEAAVA